MASYKSGQVSAQLFAKGGSSKQNGLASLFVTKSIPKPALQTSPVIVNKEVAETKKTPKKDILTPSKPKSKSPSNQATSTWAPPFIHETLLKKKSEKSKSPAKQAKKHKLEKDDGEESLKKRPRRDRMRDKKNDNRTVFVGNCPLSADRKVLKSLFKEFGDIESIRFRCAPPADPNLPRRAIVITKNFHEQCKNYVAYIVYKEEEAAKKALERNGYLLDGLHLRVDISSMSKKHDKKTSIFVGNLPFDVTEEDLYSHFEDCGEIKNVRLVRDRQTSLGKGIGYVQFDSKDSVSLALKLNKTKVGGRELRVMVCTNKPVKPYKKPVKLNIKNKEKSGSGKNFKVKERKPTFAPSNVTTATFQDTFKIKREKRLRKLKKKKGLAKKSESEGFDSILRPIFLTKRGKTNSKMANKKKGVKGGKKFIGQKGKKNPSVKIAKGQKAHLGKKGKKKS